MVGLTPYQGEYQEDYDNPPAVVDPITNSARPPPEVEEAKDGEIGVTDDKVEDEPLDPEKDEKAPMRGDPLVPSDTTQTNSKYMDDYDNPPAVTDSLGAPPTALHAEEFVGDPYWQGPFGKKKKNQDDDSKIVKFASGVHEGLEKPDNEKSVMATIRELILHFFFLIVVCMIAFSSCSSSTYYFTQVMSDLFVNTLGPTSQYFTDIGTMDDVWVYASNQLVDGLYFTQIPSSSNATSNQTDGNGTDNAMVFYENRLLGQPRMRMLKVTNDSCTVVKSFSREIKECYAQYAKDKEDTADFAPDNATDKTPFTYSTAEELENGDLWGKIATYGGGGFVQYFSTTDGNETLDAISVLKANRWINRGTRLVVIDFSLYNANLNLFCVVKLVLELPATGGVIPSSQFNSMKLIRYVSTFDYVVLACEGIFILFTIFFIFEEFLDIAKMRIRYLKDFWNIIDLVVIALSVVCIILSLHRTSLSRDRINKVLENDLTSAPFDDVVSAESNYNNVAAILLFFSWIKVFKYISFNKTMSQLSATLSRSAKDIGGFAVMFFVFFFAYAQFGYLVFGTQIEDYSTFYDAVFALFRTILGDFDFPALENANRVLGPLFFITYVFFVFFVLLNMFLAIINDTYVEVKAELARQSDDFQVAAFFTKGCYRLLRFLHLTNANPELDSNIDYDAWKAALTKNGFTEDEINEKFLKYEVYSWTTMDTEQRNQIEKELEDEKREREKRAEEYKDIMMVGRRIDLIENSITNIATRIEDVVSKLKIIEIEKIRTREFAGRMLQKENAANYIE